MKKNINDLLDGMTVEELDLLLTAEEEMTLPKNISMKRMTQRVYQSIGLSEVVRPRPQLHLRRWIAIVACVCIVLAGSAVGIWFLNSDETGIIVPEETEIVVPDVDYVIYLSGNSLAGTDKTDSSVTIGESAAAGVPVDYFPKDVSFYPNYNQKSDVVLEESPLQTLRLDGREYEFGKHWYMEDTSMLDAKSPFQKYGKTVMCIQSGQYHVAYQLETGRLIDFFDSKLYRNVNGEFTEADAIAKSKQIVKEVYGEECLKYYSSHPCESQLGDDGVIAISYIKYVGGYPTNDRVVLHFNQKGELCGLSAECYGFFETVAEKYPVQQFKNAETVLNKHLDSVAVSHQDARLLMSTQGKCYLEVRANCGTEEKVSMRTFYINVD